MTKDNQLLNHKNEKCRDTIAFCYTCHPAVKKVKNRDGKLECDRKSGHQMFAKYSKNFTSTSL